MSFDRFNPGSRIKAPSNPVIVPVDFDIIIPLEKVNKS